MKLRKEMYRSSMLSSLIGLPLSGDLESCKVSDVTGQHPKVLRLQKELEKEKEEKAKIEKDKAKIEKDKELLEQTLL